MVGFNYRFAPAVQLAKKLVPKADSVKFIISAVSFCRIGSLIQVPVSMAVAEGNCWFWLARRFGCASDRYGAIPRR